MSKIPEEKIYYHYIWYWIHSGITCYHGHGKGGRINAIHDKQEKMQKLKNQGIIATKSIKENLTKGEAQSLEASGIKEDIAKGIKLFNKQSGNSKIFIKSKSNKVSTDEQLRLFYQNIIKNNIVEEKVTPTPIINEIINVITSSSGFTIDENFSIFNPKSRFGEWVRPLCDKLGTDIIKGNGNTLTMNDTKLNMSVFFCTDYSKGINMNDVLVINEDFDKWNTTEKYYVILMNPPFIKFGEKFILKCMNLLKDGGYLGCVMSPTWRSIVTDKGQHKKAYTKMVKQGGFHYIHMYNTNDTSNLFKQNIGQVDTFVWQKGVKINNTTIINQRGDKYQVNLNKYPQAPPVLPSYIYDKYFDQINGIKWYRFTHPNDKSYGPSNNVFISCIDKKEFKCNDTNIKNSMGKKIIVDQRLNSMFVDKKGDIISNQEFIFFFNINKKRSFIIKNISFMMQNKDLFMITSSIQSASIPGIKINEFIQ